MATFAPLLPGLAPDPQQQADRRQGLKPSTWQRLAAQKRRRAFPMVLPVTQLTPLLPQDPTPAVWDFLDLWYHRVRHDGEHAGLWGALGLSPSKFVTNFAQVPLLLLHEATRPWYDVDGLLQVCWLDDVVPELRARCHHWVAPGSRSLRVSLPLGQQMLRYLFDTMGFLLLEGRTPVIHQGAVRYVQRLGFRLVATLPYGEWGWTPEGARTMIAVVQSQLTIDEWRAHHA